MGSKRTEVKVRPRLFQGGRVEKPWEIKKHCGDGLFQGTKVDLRQQDFSNQFW